MTLVSNKTSAAELLALYDEASSLNDHFKELDNAKRSAASPEALQKIEENIKKAREAWSIVKCFTRDSLFAVLKQKIFNGDVEYQKIPELVLTEADAFFGSRKLCSDGGFNLDLNTHVNARLMRGYNPILKVHFFVIKGLVWEGNIKYGTLQYFHQSKYQTCPEWDVNGLRVTSVSNSGNVLDSFMGELIGPKNNEGQGFLLTCSREEDKLINALKIYLDAPKIIQATNETFRTLSLPQPLAGTVVSYYTTDINA